VHERRACHDEDLCRDQERTGQSLRGEPAPQPPLAARPSDNGLGICLGDRYRALQGRSRQLKEHDCRDTKAAKIHESKPGSAISPPCRRELSFRVKDRVDGSSPPEGFFLDEGRKMGSQTRGYKTGPGSARHVQETGRRSATGVLDRVRDRSGREQAL
jgi:hypothetical protein